MPAFLFEFGHLMVFVAVEIFVLVGVSCSPGEYFLLLWKREGNLHFMNDDNVHSADGFGLALLIFPVWCPVNPSYEVRTDGFACLTQGPDWCLEGCVFH